MKKVYQAMMWLYNRGNNIAKFTVNKGSFKTNYIQWVYNFSGDGEIETTHAINWDNYNNLYIRIIFHASENANKPEINMIASVKVKEVYQKIPILYNVPDQKEILLKLDVSGCKGIGSRLLIYAREVSSDYGISPKAEIYEVYLD